MFVIVVHFVLSSEQIQIIEQIVLLLYKHPMKTKGIWAQLRDIATSEPGDEDAETEKGMAIAALVAAYRFLLKKRKKKGMVGGKVPVRGKMSMDKNDSP